MEAPFPFDSILAFGFLSALLLVGIALRAVIPTFQYFLLPSCLIGGILGLILMYTFPLGISVSTLEAFAYHFFNISFISIGLTREAEDKDRSYKSKDLLRGASWMALMQGLTFPLQAILGGLLVIGLGFMGVELFSTFGFLGPLGFNEGPGQALSMGKAWEALGFEHGGTIGLTFAGIGFGFGFLVGVPLVNYGIRKGMATFGPKSLPRDFLVGILPKGGKKESAGTLTLHSGNAETLALHAALVGTVYLLTYFTIIYVGRLVPPDAQPMLWGFCFMVGLAIALIVKRIISALGLDYLTDPGVQRRITGWSVDFLTIATISAVQLAVVWQFMLPISLMALTMGICTTALVVFFARRLEAYNLERMAAIYGTVTGTVACGLLLVRIVDPEFKTPAAFEVGLMNVFVVPIIGACMFLTNGPLWWDWSVATTILVFLAIAIICGTLLRVMKLWGDVKELHGND